MDNNLELKNAMTKWFDELFNMIEKEEPGLYKKIKTMVLAGRANEVRDFIWESTFAEKFNDEKSLLERVKSNDSDSVDDWSKRAKSGEVMRII